VVGTFKFTSSGNPAALAMYSENKLSKTWKKRGKLRFYDNQVDDPAVAAEIELLVVLCCAVTNEKRRRKTWKKWALMGVLK
jgi:hypothetical protein